MATPRVSSRLATKKRSNAGRTKQFADFEYTPLLGSIKKECHSGSDDESESPRKKNRQKNSHSTPATEADPQETPPKTPSSKRKRGRPPKVSTNSGDQTTARTTNSKPHVNCTVDGNLKNDSKEGLGTLLESKVPNGNMNCGDQIFSIVAALLPSKLMETIPGGTVETMDTVAIETDVKWENHKDETIVIYGSLPNLNKANAWLEKLILKSQLADSTEPVDTKSCEEATLNVETSPGKVKNAQGEMQTPPASSDVPCTEINTSEIPDDSTQLAPTKDANPSSGIQRKSLTDESAQGVTNAAAVDEDTRGVTEQVTAESRDQSADVDRSTKDEVSQEGNKAEDVPAKSHPRRQVRQLRCQHKSTDCQICQSYCDQCKYRSTEVGLRKHKQRVHPTVTFECEICDMAFGIRYDMRRHRLVHFDLEGNLNAQGRKIIEKSNKSPSVKETLIEQTLADYEKSFIHNTVTGDDYVKSAVINDTETNATHDVPARAAVQCGYCDVCGTADEVSSHHTSVHRVVSMATISYQCSKCGGGGFYSEEEFSRHCREECVQDGNPRDDPQAKCLVCGMVSDSDSIGDHLKNHAMSLQCVLCQHMAESTDDMESHITENHSCSDVKPDMSKCNDVKGGKVKAPKRHMNPPKETSVLYKCGICERIFKSRSSLHVHFRSHQESKIYPCGSCDFVTEKLGIFNAHVANKHSVIDKRQCEICLKVFAMPSTLKFHRESVHGIGQKLHQCELCQKEFTAKRFLQVHIKRMHAKMQRFFCPVCAKGFFDKARMVQHHETHLPASEQTRKFVCSYCGRGFRQKHMLRQHENIHEGLKPHKCKLCDKAFCSASELNKHHIAHNNYRPHVCSYCGKGFKFRYKLTAHMTTHTRQGQFACPDCNKVYTARATLRKHICKARIMDDVIALKQQAELKAKMRGPSHVDGSGVFLMEPDVVTTTTSADKTVYLHSVKQETAESVLGILSGRVDTSHVVEVLGNDEDIADEVTTIMQAAEVKLEDTGTIDDSRPMSLDVHQESSANGPGVLYMCSICNNLFQDQADVNAHMNSEHGAEAIIGQEEPDEMDVIAGSILETAVENAEFLVQDDLQIDSEGAI